VLHATLLCDAAVVEWRAGDARRAREIAEEAVAAAHTPRTLYNIAEEVAPRDPLLGREICQRSLEMMGPHRYDIRPGAMLGIARIDLEEGRLEEAREGTENALALAQEMGKNDGVIEAEALLAEVALHAGDVPVARRHAEQADRHARSAVVSPTAALYAKALVDLAEGELDAAADALAEALETWGTTELAFFNPLNIYERMAQVEAARDRPERAATLLGRADLLRLREALPRSPVKQSAFDALRAELQRELGEAAYRAAVERGAQMTPADATTFALDRQ
jgi:tetratricopeptide (TPR) repeat protein